MDGQTEWGIAITLSQIGWHGARKTVMGFYRNSTNDGQDNKQINNIYLSFVIFIKMCQYTRGCHEKRQKKEKPIENTISFDYFMLVRDLKPFGIFQ